MEVSNMENIKVYLEPVFDKVCITHPLAKRWYHDSFSKTKRALLHNKEFENIYSGRVEDGWYFLQLSELYKLSIWLEYRKDDHLAAEIRYEDDEMQMRRVFAGVDGLIDCFSRAYELIDSLEPNEEAFTFYKSIKLAIIKANQWVDYEEPKDRRARPRR